MMGKKTRDEHRRLREARTEVLAAQGYVVTPKPEEARTGPANEAEMRAWLVLNEKEPIEVLKLTLTIPAMAAEMRRQGREDLALMAEKQLKVAQKFLREVYLIDSPPRLH